MWVCCLVILFSSWHLRKFSTIKIPSIQYFGYCSALFIVLCYLYSAFLPLTHFEQESNMYSTGLLHAPLNHIYSMYNVHVLHVLLVTCTCVWICPLPLAASVPTEFFYRIAEFHANDFKKLVKCYLWENISHYVNYIFHFQKALFEPALLKVFAMCQNISLSSPELSGCFAVLEMYSRHSNLAKVYAYIYTVYMYM